MINVSDDLFIGRALLDQGVIGREELVDAVIEAARERQGGKYGRPLGVVLMDRGLITEDQLAGVVAKRVDPSGGDVTQMAEIALGKLFIASGYATKEQVEECLKEQQRRKQAGGQAGRLGELLVERGYSTNQQVMRILAYQTKRIYECPSCKARYNVSNPRPGAVYRCKKCQQPLQPVVKSAAEPNSLTRTVEIAKAILNRAETDQAEIDRAVALYLRQKFIVRRDLVRDAERIQMEIARFGQIVSLADVLERIGAMSPDQRKALDKVDFAAMIRKEGWAKQDIPGFRVLDRLASGGFWTLYRAEPVFGGPAVSIKVLHQEYAKEPGSVKQFQTEGMMMFRMKHAGLVRGIGAEENEGVHYIVIEALEGRSLGQRVAENGALSTLEAVTMVRQIAEALKYLHSQGMAHRDVKPDTIFVDGTGKARIMSLAHMSAMSAADASRVGVDIFLLGMTLYSMLTGVEPWRGAEPEDMAGGLLQEGLPSPNLMLVQAPAPLIRLLKHMIHPDPARRFGSMDEVLQSMEKVL